MSETICCTLVSCNCENFKPGKLKRRQCENCKHGWVAHALSKLKVHHMYQSSQVEIVHSNVVFDICSLMLYGTQAVPIRLKILLDRLFSVLKQDEVLQILHALDWTLQDYIRGYVLQDVAGKVLDRWAIMTFEEEIATLQQFLRFGETKSIVELMALQDKEGQAVLVPSTRTNSDIRTFIERNTPRTVANLSNAKVEKLSGSSMHHFENFVNSMAFMLPFQLLGSVPAPFLATPTGPLQHLQNRREECKQQGHGPEDEEQDSSDRTKPVSFSHCSESGVLRSNSFSFLSEAEPRGEKSILSLSCTKTEADDFSASDNYSDGPSTPCTPSVSSDVTQMSPDGKLRSLDRNGVGGLLKKGRVFCSACEKTFYDKGTLKIHYNAVHLKIKHKCTIDGCNMVFSSLRSRNRHSANPNPRLHMPMNRNNRDKDLQGGLSADESSQGERRPEYGTPSSMCSDEGHKPVPSYVVSHVDSKLHSSSFPSISHSGILFPNLKTVQPVLPFYRSLVTPAELANTPGTLPSLPLLSSSVPIKPITASEPSPTEPVPKKKSRKSSMPIKIEKDSVELDQQMVKETSSEDEAPSQARDQEYQEYEGRGGGARAREPQSDEDHGTKHMFNHNLIRDHDQYPGLTCESRLMETSEDQEEPDHGSPPYAVHPVDQGEGSDPEDDQTPHRCEICSKAFRSSYSINSHYQSVHVEELHTCTVEGCNASFPSRRSRDRHSVNVNLHHKLLTKDSLSPGHAHHAHHAPSFLSDRDSEFPQDQRDRTLLHRDPTNQTSVIFRGHNRTGLVFPMSKETETSSGSPGEGEGEGTVLDLSTSTSAAPRGWDSDGASEEGGAAEEQEEEGEELTPDCSDESCDGIGGGRLLGEEQEEKNLGCAGPGPGGAGLPIRCHICQKVYSNKGTFRAHYKTVHLRLLHKCKVPGCDTAFSSVRSRNRHSQNPNLHRNLAPLSHQ